MVLISMPGGETRTPSYHSMSSPRYGGCVGAFLHFFDWNPGKRFYSTKRLPASKPEDGMRRSRSMRSDHGSTARARMICDAQRREDAVAAEESSSVASSHAVPGILLGDDASSRAPSVVARLMGLESLPKGPYQPSTQHRRSQSYSGAGELPFAFMTVMDQKQQAPTVLLQDLLQRDLKTASKRTLRDRIPGFAKRAQEQYENRFSKKGAALKALRCRQDECISPYIDIPDVPSKSKPSPKQPFLLRLAPATSSPSTSSLQALHPSDETHHVAPELSLQATGWPLAGKVSHESSFRSERSSLLESESSSSRTKSKPALANVARKIFQGRRRAAGAGSWNGSEDSESNSSQVELPESGPLIRAPRKPSRVTGRELALKKVAKSLSPPPARHRAIRLKSATHHEVFVREFKAPGGSRITTTAQSTRTKAIVTEDIASEPLIPSRTRSTDFQSTGAAIQSAQDTNPRAQESGTPIVIAKTLNRPGAKQARNAPSRISKPDHPKLASKSPPLDGHRTPKSNAHGKAVKAGSQVVSSKQTTKNTLQGIQRVRETMLVDRLMSAPDQASVDDTDGSTVNISTVRGYRKNGKHARARSIDEVFPELPLDSSQAKPCAPCGPIYDGTTANVRLGNDPISTEPCDEVLKSPVASCAESQILMTEQVFHVDLQEFFAAGPDDLRWEDEEQRVNSPSLSGRFCELRSCSGPSVSSASVGNVSDVDDERNGDAWSSCASYNPADCDSPRTFELPDTDADEADLHESKSTPMIFAKKVSELDSGDDHEATGVDAGQPSPVSILNSPFHDEAGTTDEDGFKSSGNSSSENLSPAPLKSYSESSDNDKIRQALLDISMFQSFTFDYNSKELSSNPKECEKGFVREILSAANLMSEGPSSPDRFHQNVAIDPSLFDRLESGDIEESAGGVEKMIQARSGGLWRCDRKLLFDCVNEAFALTLWQSWCSEMGLQWYASSRPRGQKLVEEVYTKIEDWRKFTSLSIDFLIERDMGFRCGEWKTFSAEVAEVGMDIESMLWKAIVEEVVMDMVKR